MTSFELALLPARIDDATLGQLDATAGSALPALPACDPQHFLHCLRMLWAALPKRPTDKLSGKLMAAAYERELGHHSRAAVDYLTDHALAECRFFPSLAECREILSRWRRGDEPARAQAMALSKARQEREARLDDIRRRLKWGEMTQAEVDGLSVRTQRILDGENLVRIGHDGVCRVLPAIFPLPTAGDQ